MFSLNIIGFGTHCSKKHIYYLAKKGTFSHCKLDILGHHLTVYNSNQTEIILFFNLFATQWAETTFVW